MGLFDLFRRSAPQPQPAPAAPAGAARFERDPARMFDTARTQALAQLFAVPRPQRDAAWIERFWEAAWTAALVVHDPPVASGPDSFPYLRLDLPAAATYDANCLMNVAASLVDQGAGAAIFASAEADMTEAEWVIPLGVLDSILRFDDPGGEPVEIAEVEGRDPTGTGATTLKAGEQVLVATPSAYYLPPPVARALYRLLQEDWGLSDPRVALLVSHALCPSRSLVIGQSRANLIARGATDAQITGWMHRIGWYLPPSRGLMLMPEDWSLSQMTRLKELF